MCGLCQNYRLQDIQLSKSVPPNNPSAFAGVASFGATPPAFAADGVDDSLT
jgi:hypothetical protein